ncbi:NADP-reducing hydrogenase subunit HndD [Lachnospiraceae bacterium PF1-21]|uniref:[FeFe] hydrogenase, group A n=1 Tax=Ohessyouella blattaphilus TaxID=2949333 RepID=UPI003E2BC609
MVNLTIDGKQIAVAEGTTIMEAAAMLDITIPKLCYLKEINEIGACRVCVVEVEGMDRVVTSCNHLVEDGMVVMTNSPKVRDVRKTNVQLILSEHNSNCPTCIRNGNCSLQDLADHMGLLSVPYKTSYEEGFTDTEFPIIRDSSKCIKCMRCVSFCDKVQGLEVWDVINTGYRTTVGVKDNKEMAEANCSMCGQCVTHCPVGALTVRRDIKDVYDALHNPDIITVVQVAPAVRAGFADALGVDGEELTQGQMVTGLKQLGFDYVFDTNFTADLTIMEEGSELIHKLTHRDEYAWPMFTSCCPGWVRFMKSEYPEMVDQLSTAKSPQQMFGAVAKTYFAEKIGVDPSRLHVISVMPCSAKKYECSVDEVNVVSGVRDVDTVLITREMLQIMKMDNIDLANLEESEFDSPLGEGTGAAVIFGASGGVMEAALRSAYFLLKGENIDPDAFKEVRGFTERRELEANVDGTVVRCAAVSSLGEARELIEDIKAGKVTYDFVEVMACPGGCAGGGGQPINDGEERGALRGSRLYQLDRDNKVRYSHENSEVQILYKEYLEKPLSEKSHHLLHTHQKDWVY